MSNTLDIDVDTVRLLYGEAIEAYRGAARELEATRPQVAPESFGAGFGEQAQRLVQALDALHDASCVFLETRSNNWEQLVELAGVVAEADESVAETTGVVEEAMEP